MQPASVLVALGLLGAFQMAYCNEIVEEHNDLTDETGILEAPAGLDAVAFANTRWPTITTIMTSVKTVTTKPHWTTLTTVPLVHITTKTHKSGTSTIHPSPTTSLSKRAESPTHFSTIVHVVVDANGHRSTSTEIEQKPFSTSTASTTIRSTSISKSTLSSGVAVAVTLPKEVHFIEPTSPHPTISTSTRTTTVRPGNARFATPSVSLISGQTIVIPGGIEAISVTQVKPHTKTKKAVTTTTTTAPAKTAIVVLESTPITSHKFTPVATATNGVAGGMFESMIREIFEQPWGQLELLSKQVEPSSKQVDPSRRGSSICHRSFHNACVPFNKKWLWLLTIPIILLLASIPLCIYACMRFGRRASRGEKTGYVPAAAPVQQTTAPAQTTTVAGDGGRQAEEGRAHVPADQTATQTVTKAPDGKVTTVPGTPATTVQHVETVASHDGAGSFDAGSFRGRNPGRAAHFLHF